MQAKAARENGIISAADMQAALDRLNAAISNYDPEPEPETVTVTFSSNGGSAVDAQKVEVGKTVVRPEDPEKKDMCSAAGIQMKHAPKHMISIRL